MSQQSLQRWAPLSGAAFVVLMITGFVVAGSSPSTDDSNVKIAAYLAKDSNQTKNLVAYFVLLLAMLFLVWFFNTLRSWLASAEGGDGRRGSLAFGAGIASTVFLITAIAVFISPILTAGDADKFPLDPGIYRVTQDLGYEIWVASTVVGALAVWATAAVVFQTGALPRWFAWFSVVAGVICLLAFAFFPIFVYWLWILVASSLIFTRPVAAVGGVPAAADG